MADHHAQPLALLQDLPMMAGLSPSKRDSGYKEDFIMRKGVESPEPGKIIIINGPSSAGPPPAPRPPTATS